MIELSLRPYPGRVLVCKTRADYQRQHKKLRGDYDDIPPQTEGRMAWITYPDAPPVYIVWATGPSYLAHELSHVILDTFKLVGIDPREAGGEPFCYMLSQLLLEAA